MDLQTLTNRKIDLEASLKNIEQSFHIVTGHLSEVKYQIEQLTALPVEECLAKEEILPVE